MGSHTLVRLGTFAATLLILAAPAGCASSAKLATGVSATGTMQASALKATTEAGIRQKLQALFRASDKGGKGYLTPDELPSNPVLPIVVGRPDAADPDTRAALAKILDKNGDGQISSQEFLDPDFVAELVYVQHDQAVQLFKTLDANSDGFLTRDETNIADIGEPSPMSPAEFKEMDANNDGKLTVTELENGLANPVINPLPSAE
ncbi:MAG: EF-hand domain-containing protein [Candidatus Sericytochromatia bacterium]|nr:EF-hand domain-containing protein [Candidatus Tanganyikabacteria bacterium]